MERTPVCRYQYVYIAMSNDINTLIISIYDNDDDDDDDDDIRFSMH